MVRSEEKPAIATMVKLAIGRILVKIVQLSLMFMQFKFIMPQLANLQFINYLMLYEL